ncbi:LamG-like jellyroll fold domain-containing protein [Flavobacterium sp.]|jgi:hypothetical protein|uniref:LamG-like jellyroll fold domain-containing protein n=1 Tax=Flavobacterium sp. TaxID=239 RepID=UPI0037BE2592
MKIKLLLLAIGFTLTAHINFAQIPSNIPSKGLVGYWPFNGNANDESGNGNNGSVHGATLTTDRFGNDNKAYNFSGSDWIELNSLSAINASNKLAVSIWVKSTGLNSNTNCNLGCLQYYFSRGFDSGYGFGLSTFQGNNPHFSANINGILKWGQQVQSPNITDLPHTQWHHLLMNYDGTSINFYVDGLQTATTPYNMGVGIDKKYNAVFGRQFVEGSSYYTVGMIDDAAIWNRALTEEEISNLFSDNSNKISNIINSSTTKILNPGELGNNIESTSKDLGDKNPQQNVISTNLLINKKNENSIDFKSLNLKEIISDNGCIVLTNYPDVISVSWSGNCKDSLANGKGILKYYNSNGAVTIYEGETFNGYRNGKGTYNWTTGEKYDGEWKDDKPNGLGIYTYPNGSKYEGQLSDGKKNGNGILTDINGDKYEGEWKGDLHNGQGTYTWSRGSRYVGQFRDDKPNGQGTFTWPSGSIYVGQHKDGKRHGNGILIDVDGSKYDGEWQNDKKHGQGTYSIKDGTKYVGQFIDGYMSGQGVQTDSKGEKYEGEWKYNSKEGYGINTWPDGSKYEGEWVNGKANGQGAYIYPSGSVHFGEWKDNSLIKEAPRHKIVETNSKKESSESKNLEAFAAFMRSGNSSNKNISAKSNNSTKSNQIQNQKCFDCRGTGQCSDCSKPQVVRYKKGEIPRNHNEIRLGMVICPQCGGNLMNWGTNEKESCYLCKKWSGWVLCRKCNSNGDGRSLGKCQKCEGTGYRN